MGSLEGDLAIVQCAIYLAMVPKSNGVYKAFEDVTSMVKETGSFLFFKHLFNVFTLMMKDLGYGDGYVYDYGVDDAFSGQNYFLDEMSRRQFYKPSERGFEKEIKKRLDYWLKLKKRSIFKVL